MNKALSLLIVLAVLLVILMSGLACQAGCPANSTWSAQCYNIHGEWVGSASGNGCSCDCDEVMVGARVQGCQSTHPEIYPRPQK